MRQGSRDTDESWTLHQPDLSIPIWKAMIVTDFRHLPFAGGLLDQPDWLIHDLYVLAWRKHVLEEQQKGPVLQAKPGVAKRRVFFGED